MPPNYELWEKQSLDTKLQQPLRVFYTKNPFMFVIKNTFYLNLNTFLMKSFLINFVGLSSGTPLPGARRWPKNSIFIFRFFQILK